ncbi:MAG TPA: EAL domain-containing protein [Edaphobacter sp.]|nr:EAL domain-containing protein [Edaphobacter sp.]
MISAQGCGACKDGVQEPFSFSMAFQPIVDVDAKRVFAYEALVRGPKDEPAGWVLRQLTKENQYSFDQVCRVKAIALAKRLDLAGTGASLSINFIPGAVYSPVACIQLTLKTAQTVGFPLDRLIFEITEGEEIADRRHLMNIVNEYRRHGFRMAIDDFGAGYSGFNVLADVPLDIVKLDMDLIRNIDRRPTALAIVRSMADLCRTLKVRLIAEGVESAAEFGALRECGVRLMQGYLFARPAFESLPEFFLPEDSSGFMEATREPSLAILPAV